MDHFWKEKKVLVTGASGFVGSWLVRFLIEKGACVVILERDFDPQSELIRSQYYDKIRVVHGTLEDQSCLERAINEYEIDTVFHLGAQTLVETALRSPLSTFETNIKGTYYLLDVCRLHRSLVKRILIVSSDKAYGESADFPYTEETHLLPKYPYDVSKACADMLASCYYYTYNLPIVIARSANIFGGGDLNWSRLIPGTIRSFYLGNVPEIRSDGSLVRDYLYVKDVVEAYMMLASQAHREDIRGQIFNFGTNAPKSVYEIVLLIQKLMNREDLVPKILNRVKNEIKKQCVDSSKAFAVFGWQPKWALEEGLLHAIDWYSYYLEQKKALCL